MSQNTALNPCLDDLIILDDTQFHAKFGDKYPVKQTLREREDLFFSKEVFDHILANYFALGNGDYPSMEVEDIAAYVVFCEESITLNKLHNICYLVMAISIAMEGFIYHTKITPCLPGMHCADLDHSIKRNVYWVKPEDITAGDMDSLSHRQKKLVECIIREYCKMSTEHLKEYVIRRDGVWVKSMAHDKLVDQIFIQEVYSEHIGNAYRKYSGPAVLF